jgi:hypothetical protein
LPAGKFDIVDVFEIAGCHVYENGEGAEVTVLEMAPSLLPGQLGLVIPKLIIGCKT